jgi:hypothetical protein
MSQIAMGMKLGALVLLCAGVCHADDKKIVHDAEYYILAAQNGERWSAEDVKLDAKLAELREKYGRPPNIIHIMWDDTAFGDVGIPAIQQVRGLRTPNLNRMAREGILFTRMYTEVGCTPSPGPLVSPVDTRSAVACTTLACCVNPTECAAKKSL